MALSGLGAGTGDAVTVAVEWPLSCEKHASFPQIMRNGMIGNCPGAKVP